MQVEEKTLVLIDGWWGSGKTTLRGLLDGHPQLGVCPIQESLPGLLAHDPRKLQWMQAKEVVGLRGCLGARDGYSRIERFALSQSIAFDAARRARVQRPFTFDYYQFDRSWVQALMKLDEWTTPQLTDCYYRHFMQCWKQFPLDLNLIKAYVSLDSNYPRTPQFFVNNFPQGKMLYLIRDPKGILATRAGRLAVDGDSRTADWDQLTAEGLLQQGELHRILEAYDRVYSLQKQFPDRIKLVSFEALNTNTKTVMDAIADFIGVARDESLYDFSYTGEALDSAGDYSFVGKVNDDPAELLSAFTYSLAETIENNTGIPWGHLPREPKLFIACLKIYLRRQVSALYNRVEIPLRARCSPHRFRL